MNKPITIKATVPAWLFYFNSVDDLSAAIKRKDSKAALAMLSFAQGDMSKGENPYTRIGEAEITVTLRPHDQIVVAQIDALNASLAAERAESMRRQNTILDRISKLQALTMTVDAA
jgi:hypothetical protein